MIDHLVLVVDVGGTNTRFALAERNSLIKASSARFLNADFAISSNFPIEAEKKKF